MAKGMAVGIGAPPSVSAGPAALVHELSATAKPGKKKSTAKPHGGGRVGQR